ncbi:MAG: hypothetical protein ACYC6N_03735 [Pirellulaceae bacterium]
MMNWKRLLLFSGLLLASCGTYARGDSLEYPLTGTLTSQAGGLAGFGEWAVDGLSLSWNVTNPETNRWQYEYVLDFSQRDISHFVIETSSTFTSSSYTNTKIKSGDGEWLDFQPVLGVHGGSGNAGIPFSIYGLKFDTDKLDSQQISVSFLSSREPVWVNFFAKDGTGTYAYNAYFDDNPLPDGYMQSPFTATPNVLGYVLGPDSKEVPAPSVLVGLLSMCGIGLARKFARKR